ncbi:hypothetical protein [Kitasatospora sp. LaBMicrA B282]|uniref:hypothetical protein n=1 Tax=Kitasatospora sp. LaBMicrA B282 TaxID=3420949 RepID=UPI003D0E4B7E
MTTTHAPSDLPLPVEPADLPLPRPIADALLSGLLRGTVFDPAPTPRAGTPDVPVAESAPEEAAEEPTTRMAERDRTAHAHCRFAMQYLD